LCIGVPFLPDNLSLSLSLSLSRVDSHDTALLAKPTVSSCGPSKGSKQHRERDLTVSYKPLKAWLFDYTVRDAKYSLLRTEPQYI